MKYKLKRVAPTGSSFISVKSYGNHYYVVFPVTHGISRPNSKDIEKTGTLVYLDHVVLRHEVRC